jgi:hypothetical protein
MNGQDYFDLSPKTTECFHSSVSTYFQMQSSSQRNVHVPERHWTKEKLLHFFNSEIPTNQLGLHPQLHKSHI